MALVVAVIAAVLAMSSCKARTQKPAPAVTTQTVAPAAAQPAPTGTDAMTQTVNVDNGRSDDEGGTAADTSATTTQAPAAKPAKSARKRK